MELGPKVPAAECEGEGEEASEEGNKTIKSNWIHPTSDFSSQLFL